jgi:predicted nucleic acid-binding protein
MTELLVQPYREGYDQRVDQFYALLSTYPNLEWIAPDLPIANSAARIRAEHRLRTSHALQAATAIHTGATALVTNDPAFERVESSRP